MIEKILITNHHLLSYGGTETLLLTLAKKFKEYGIEVYIYSPFLSKEMINTFHKYIVNITNDLSKFSEIDFSIAHVHHNVTAIDVRSVFPTLPIIYVANGILPFLEQPPILNLNISHYLAVSEEVRDHLISKGIKKEKISIFRNVFDIEKFNENKPINKKLKSMLVISNRLQKYRELMLRRAAKELGIRCKFVGKPFGTIKHENLSMEINKHDLTVCLGRTAIESILCGRNVFIYDYNGGDGLLTPSNFYEIIKHNLSGRRYKKEYNIETLKMELMNYNSRNVTSLKKLVIKEFITDKIEDLMNIYMLNLALPNKVSNRLEIDYIKKAFDLQRRNSEKAAIIRYKEERSVKTIFKKILNKLLPKKRKIRKTKIFF
jgi:hypothetical protein